MSTEDHGGGLHNSKETQPFKMTQKEQQLILDFYFRCGSEEDIARGWDLIASNPEASRLYDGLKGTLTELDSIKYNPYPGQQPNLVEHGYGLYNLKEGKEIKLAMQSLWLSGQVNSFGARLLVSHVLKSSETEPIEVVYSFMLPRDGTLRRFYITGEGFSTHSELRPVQQAEKDYERGIEGGHLSALSKIYRDGVVNLNVGNIRPSETITVHLEIIAGVESHLNGFRFRFPFTLAPTYHAQAKMINCGNGQGEIELPENDFGDVILPPFMKDSDNLHKIGFNLNINFPQKDIQVASPSHNIQTSHLKDSIIKTALALQSDVPNRDLVLDVHSKETAVQIHRGVDSTGSTSFICTIPATEFGEMVQKERNFVFLLDRSGSMQGKVLEQAKHALSVCVSALTNKDCFSIIAFDNEVEIFDRLVSAADDVKNKAEAFLERIDARGGTEVSAGIKAAAEILGGKGGDIMLITDGQVSGTEDIIRYAKSVSVKLHILGIGTASQDRFFANLAGQTGGTSRFVTPRERIDLVARELFSGIGNPVANDLVTKIIGTEDGKIEPEIASEVYEHSSLQISGHFNHKDTPRLILEWKNQGQDNIREYSLAIENNSNGNTLRLIRGSKLITGYESKLTASSGQLGSEKREERRIKDWIERLSTEYGLASSQMALVSVVEREGDRSGVLPKTNIVPVGMPQDVKFDSYFDNTISLCRIEPVACRPKPQESCHIPQLEMLLAPPEQQLKSLSIICSLYMKDIYSDELKPLAYKMEADGGMPGHSLEDRILVTITTLIDFIKEGVTADDGPYKNHVNKMIEFIKENIKAVSKDVKKIILDTATKKIEGTVFKNEKMKAYAKDLIKQLQ